MLMLSTEFYMLVLFKNLNHLEFLVSYLDFLCLVSVKDGFQCFWMGSLPKNIYIMLMFLKAPFL